MKTLGMLKVALAITMNFIFFYAITGNLGAGALVSAGILLYAWLGEYLSLKKDGAISMKNLDDYEQGRLEAIRKYLIDDVKRVSNLDISGIKIHLIPTDDLNAYAYGTRNVGVTREVLRACDDITICGILGHEISHTLCLDALFHRVIFADVTILMLWLSLGSIMGMAMLGIMFFILCIMGVCGGFASIMLFRGFRKMMGGIFSLLQHFLLFIYQTVMGLISRRAEYRADRYSCQLGYGLQLSEFLSLSIQQQETPPGSLGDVLYASHPPTHKRVMQIKQEMEKQYPVAA